MNVPRFIDHDKQTLEHRVALAALNSAALAAIVAFRTEKANFLQGIKKCYDITYIFYGNYPFHMFLYSCYTGPKTNNEANKNKQTKNKTKKTKKDLL